MPIFIYENPNTGEIKEVVQSVHEKHEYSEGKVKWNRVWVNPTCSFDSNSKIDPFDSKDFAAKTGRKKGTLGDMLDCSAEMSQIREQKAGKDPVKEKYFEEWSKTRRGRKHPKSHSKVIENKMFKVEL